MDQPALLHQMQLLREEYASGLKLRLQQIEGIFQQLEGQQDDDLAQELFRQVHSLAGSAASFGFIRISTQARSLEAILQQSIKQDKPLMGKSRQQISEGIGNLQQLTRDGPDEALSSQIPSIATSDDSIESQAFKVYLLESDESQGAEIQSQLEYAGFSVQLFADTKALRQAMSTKLPDAILMDIMFWQRETGESDTDLPLKNFKDAGVPVIFLASRGDWQTRLGAVRAGGQAYLTRPVDSIQLLNLLEQVTRKRTIQPYRVLIVDDAVDLARYYALVLDNAGMQVETLTRPENILTVIANFKPELIVLDLYMSNVTGYEVANVIRQHQDLLGLPIVFLSTEQDRYIQLRALQNGDDFLQKPISDEHLVAAISSRAERARILSTLMYRDGLTGLLNRSTLSAQLESEIHRAIRVDSSLCFIMLALDNVKQLNDTYGHPVVDRILKGLARLLTDRLRKTDKVGRYSGKRYGVILPDTDQTSAMTIREEVRQKFSSLVFTANGTDFQCTFSAGISQLDSNDSALSLIRRAQETVYMAKKSGRNCIKLLE